MNHVIKLSNNISNQQVKLLVNELKMTMQRGAENEIIIFTNDYIHQSDLYQMVTDVLNSSLNYFVTKVDGFETSDILKTIEDRRKVQFNLNNSLAEFAKAEVKISDELPKHVQEIDQPVKKEKVKSAKKKDRGSEHPVVKAI